MIFQTDWLRFVHNNTWIGRNSQWKIIPILLWQIGSSDSIFLLISLEAKEKVEEINWWSEEKFGDSVKYVSWIKRDREEDGFVGQVGGIF